MVDLLGEQISNNYVYGYEKKEQNIIYSRHVSHKYVRVDSQNIQTFCQILTSYYGKIWLYNQNLTQSPPTISFQT